MRVTVSLFPEYEASPRGLEKLITDLRRERGMNDAAAALGYSRSTVAHWLKKLEAFRQFAGQSPRTILFLLAAVKTTRSLDEAAELILIDPRTLEQAFKQFEIEDIPAEKAA